MYKFRFRDTSCPFADFTYGLNRYDMFGNPNVGVFASVRGVPMLPTSAIIAGNSLAGFASYNYCLVRVFKCH